jgi:hypothetical protein
MEDKEGQQQEQEGGGQEEQEEGGQQQQERDEDEQEAQQQAGNVDADKEDARRPSIQIRNLDSGKAQDVSPEDVHRMLEEQAYDTFAESKKQTTQSPAVEEQTANRVYV